MRDMFTEVPFPLDFKIYLFNVTNKEEVFRGGKPKLQEVGPYYFELSFLQFVQPSFSIPLTFDLISRCLLTENGK